MDWWLSGFPSIAAADWLFNLELTTLVARSSSELLLCRADTGRREIGR